MNSQEAFSSHKLTGPAVAAADLGPIDVVLLSHDHGDNLDAAAGPCSQRPPLPRITLVGGDLSARRHRSGGRCLKDAPVHSVVRSFRLAMRMQPSPCRSGSVSPAASPSVLG
jgi:hypothetical protein